VSRPDHAFRARRVGRPIRTVWILSLLASVACAGDAPRGDSTEIPTPDVAARIAAFESGFGPGGDAEGRPWTIAERMKEYGVPGLSLAVIDDGEVAWAKGYGVLRAGAPEPVNTETVFSVGSVSKVGTAAATLRLVDAGRLDLDRDVNELLSSWQVPPNDFDEAVTLRQIMSHTAGLTVHGFQDYQPGAELPTTVQILEGSGPAQSPPVFVDIPPGSQFRYSGGGVTVEQLVIEEEMESDYPSAARELVFEPLGMTRSTYENPIPVAFGNIAKAHDGEGRPRAWPRGFEAMPEAGASGLWTTPSDYAKLVIAFIESYRGVDGAFLSPGLARDMMTEVEPGPYGLGPELAGEGAARRFSHGGANDSYRAFMQGNLATGDGVVIFTNGERGGALASEALRSAAGAEGWDDALVTSPESAPIPEESTEGVDLSPYEGTYAFEGVAEVQILARDGQLFGSVGGNEVRLRYQGEHTFVINANQSIVFLPDADPPGAEFRVGSLAIPAVRQRP